MGAQRPVVTAILVDGGFYRRRARLLFGDKEPSERANELVDYCRRHIRTAGANLYRIFYYDCQPSERVLFPPLAQKQVNLGKSEEFRWNSEFLKEIVKKRKVALRRGEELETQNGYMLKSAPLKKLCRGTISVDDLRLEDFYLDIIQKGVDMRIGLDIATMAERGIVTQIIMISGDSDFVPAAKYARRAGIDFIIDPLWARISDSLNEHVDGVRECVRRPPLNEEDPLHTECREKRQPQDSEDLEL
ncbi:NYN domain-containing protein [Corynebacterium sp. c8Ua_174]|uniref:NYN domain-containing protein n=2 Tax=Corynebacterium evansiae TaxID=2913499 RepID=A0A9X3RH10_9CORY|nr:NYN domain-containing protein [Corynebacterium evansiae]MCZ9290421.1 NYN domain-containing protein [Corynebacterium evansiae]